MPVGSSSENPVPAIKIFEEVTPFPRSLSPQELNLLEIYQAGEDSTTSQILEKLNIRPIPAESEKSNRASS